MKIVMMKKSHLHPRKWLNFWNWMVLRKRKIEDGESRENSFIPACAPHLIFHLNCAPSPSSSQLAPYTSHKKSKKKEKCDEILLENNILLLWLTLLVPFPLSIKLFCAEIKFPSKNRSCMSSCKHKKFIVIIFPASKHIVNLKKQYNIKIIVMTIKMH